MEERNPREAWYDQTIPEISVPPVEAPRPKKNRRTGVKVIAAVAGVLVLIVASVLAFSDRKGPESTRGGTPRSAAGIPGEYAEDFRAFFEEYYGQSEETHTGSAMERVAGDPARKVELVSAEGREELSLQELYQNAIKSVVGLRTTYAERRGAAWGSGVVLSADGYILTNQHIVDGAAAAVVVLPDGTESEARLIGEDIQTDLAVLKIEAENLIPAEFGNSAALTIGDRVAAIGNPLGDEFSGTLTDGIVSAIDRDISMGGRRMTLLQTNAAINEGSSGGPLLNMYGQVVGIVNMKMVNYYSTTPIEGLGFAIPSTVIKTIADKLIADGAVMGRPALGVTLGSIPAEVQSHYKLPDGLYVYSVAEGGDAREKGLRAGDIVTRVNGQRVMKTDDVLAIRDTLSVGDAMTLTVWREGTTFDVEIILRDQNEIHD